MISWGGHHKSPKLLMSLTLLGLYPPRTLFILVVCLRGLLIFSFRGLILSKKYSLCQFRIVCDNKFLLGGLIIPKQSKVPYNYILANC